MKKDEKKQEKKLSRLAGQVKRQTRQVRSHSSQKISRRGGQLC